MTDLNEIQARVRAARRRAIPPIDLRLPFNEMLWGTFRPIRNFEQQFEIEEAHENASSRARAALLQSVDQLVATCVDTFIPEDSFVEGEQHDGDRISLGMGLGADLARWLDVDGSDNPMLTDAQAVFLMFGEDTVSIGQLRVQLQEHEAEAGKTAEVELAKNSPTPSSSSSEQPAASIESTQPDSAT